MDTIDRFLEEDLNAEGDITSKALFTNEKGTGIISVKEACVIAGLDEAALVFNKLGATFHPLVSDGDQVKKNTSIAEITGTLTSILTGERLALNFLGRMSAIATATRNLVDRCKKINPSIQIAATRKTTPGFRKYEKKAVQIGGGEPHRFGLYDAIMIKDNHIKAVGSVKESIQRAKKVKNKIIEVEVENETDAMTAAQLNVDVIMLDNFDAKNAEKIAKQIRKNNSSILIEISGGINPDNIIEYASFADRISMGYLTHSVKNKDISLELK